MQRLSTESRDGVVSAPHALAAQAGLDVLGRGANALEAAVAVAATIAVVYPHMNSLGGDAFWLIADADGGLHGIDAAGQAGRDYTPALYAGSDTPPTRGGLAAISVGGAVGAWQAAYDLSRQRWAGTQRWGDLLAEARRYAQDGFPVSPSHARTLADLPEEVRALPGFAATFMPEGCAPVAGQSFRQPDLARTLATLQTEGAESFYRGSLAARLVEGLRAGGSRLRAEDFADFRPRPVEPLRFPYGRGELLNMPPPSQGVASMMIAGVLERYGLTGMDPLGADYVHAAVEATKGVFALRDRHVCDPAFSPVPLDHLLDPGLLGRLAARIDPQRAAPPGRPPAPGDTVWFGVVDGRGRAVSVIQSIYHEFGSGLVAGDTGVVWNNRGCAFSLEAGHANVLAPGKRPFHTLNPAMYREDGCVRLVYGTMGGDGQPQTQAALLTRALEFGYEPAEAVAAPRWVYGRTWGDSSAGLRLESRFAPEVFEQLRRRGHEVSAVAEFSDLMGHAGMIRVNRGGLGLHLEAAADPRSDGAALGL